MSGSRFVRSKRNRGGCALVSFPKFVSLFFVVFLLNEPGGEGRDEMRCSQVSPKCRLDNMVLFHHGKHNKT